MNINAMTSDRIEYLKGRVWAGAQAKKLWKLDADFSDRCVRVTGLDVKTVNNIIDGVRKAKEGQAKAKKQSQKMSAYVNLQTEGYGW